MRTISQVAEAMKRVLTRVASKAGRRSGFVQRRSKLSGSKWVQTLCFGYLANPQASLSELSQTAGVCGCQITAQGLDERFSFEAAECLREVLSEAVKVMISSGGGSRCCCCNVGDSCSSLLERFREVRVTDATTIGLPKALATQYRGCGNHIKGGEAAIKVSVGWELRKGRLVGVVLGEGRAAEMKLVQEHPPIERGALDLCDLGYYSITRLRELDKQGAYFITHLQCNSVIFDQEGRRYKLVDFFKKQRKGRSSSCRVDVEVTLGVREQVRCRLVAEPVSREVANERRQKMLREARLRGEKVPPEKLRLAAWTIYVTNVPEEKLTAEEVVLIGRVRWQIELLFKLWKSFGRIDEWRSQKPEKILCEVYAKLLAMIIEHWVMLTGAWRNADRSIWKAAQTISKHSLWLCYALRHSQLEDVLESLALILKRGCKITKRKKRPATFQLLALDCSP
jgi:hypothetical protein